jgi:hypothetical protein
MSHYDDAPHPVFGKGSWGGLAKPYPKQSFAAWPTNGG